MDMLIRRPQFKLLMVYYVLRTRMPLPTSPHHSSRTNSPCTCNCTCFAVQVSGTRLGSAFTSSVAVVLGPTASRYILANSLKNESRTAAVQPSCNSQACFQSCTLANGALRGYESRRA